MKIIISRHGEAEDYSSSGRDFDRSLTDAGRLDIAKMANFIKNSSLKVQHIYHSPYLRTKQTAEIYSSILQLPEQIELCEELAPNNDCMDLVHRIRNFSNSETFLLISHNPGIAFFASRLIQDESLYESLLFMPGTTIAINIARERFTKGQIIWMISPRDLPDA
ncbi:MAG: phosphohistidine phosphatase SixA [Leptospiraceae bacterium]|nr:phosphohistidine phosphatase SixA [Leptospiraceae bacterium]MCP5513814.1 phosphohistidine phosphatase SixA [Leptospiraceae bacterium]